MSNLKEMQPREYLNSREYSRVDAYLPVFVMPVPEGERQNILSRASAESVLTSHAEIPEVNDPLLSDSLKILNAKLDTIIRMLSFEAAEQKVLRYEKVNISAGGICLETSEDFKPGELLEIRLTLPASPYSVFYVYGSVVNSQESACGNVTSIEFTEIDEDIREQIAKFVFERQREILRKKRRD